MIKLLFLCSAMFFGVANGAEPIGIVAVDGNGNVSIFTGERLDPRTQVSFQYIDSNHKIKCCRSIDSSELMARKPDNRVSQANENPAFHYRLKNKFPAITAYPFIGIAVAVGPNRIAPNRDGSLTVASKPASFTVRSCYSQEGLHVMSGPNDKPTTDLYYFLGYDVEPTCPAD